MQESRFRLERAKQWVEEGSVFKRTGRDQDEEEGERKTVSVKGKLSSTRLGIYTEIPLFCIARLFLAPVGVLKRGFTLE